MALVSWVPNGLVNIYPPHLLSGGRSHTLKGHRIDDAADAAELEFGEAFQDGDGVAGEVLQRYVAGGGANNDGFDASGDYFCE